MSSEKEDEKEQVQEKKAVKNFIKLGRKFRGNDRSVDNDRKPVMIGKVKKHALSANKEEDLLDPLDEKPKFFNKKFIKKNMFPLKEESKDKN